MADPIRYRTIDDGDGNRTRCKVVLLNGFEGFVVRWTDSCTGCYESEDGHPVGEYDYDSKNHCAIGAGCKECGYTGKSRRVEWLPFDAEAYDAWWDKRWARRERLLSYFSRRRTRATMSPTEVSVAT
jgi:hypothetical protein